MIETIINWTYLLEGLKHILCSSMSYPYPMNPEYRNIFVFFVTHRCTSKIVTIIQYENTHVKKKANLMHKKVSIKIAVLLPVNVPVWSSYALNSPECAKFKLWPISCCNEERRRRRRRRGKSRQWHFIYFLIGTEKTFFEWSSEERKKKGWRWFENISFCFQTFVRFSCSDDLIICLFFLITVRQSLTIWILG